MLAQKTSCLGCSGHHVLTGTTGVIDLILALGTSACYKANFFPGGELILKRLNMWKICEDNSLNWIGQEEEKGRDCSLNVSHCLWRLWEMSSGILGSLRGLWCPWAHFGLSPPPPKVLRMRAWSAEGKKVMCFTQKCNPPISFWEDMVNWEKTKPVTACWLSLMYQTFIEYLPCVELTGKDGDFAI